MENIVEKISKELENNPELNEDNNDIGLPKSSLHSFVKEFLTKNKVRGDKNIIPIIDRGINKLYLPIFSRYLTIKKRYGIIIPLYCILFGGIITRRKI